MTVVLAEKPSVARDLAVFLQATKRKDGYWEGRGYQVTWAYGHLVGLKDFEDYDPRLKRWQLEHLPFFPEEFQLKVSADAAGRKQYGVIKNLFRNGDELICATDAGREGELIFRYLQILAGAVRKPFFRLWLSSLTDSAIRAGFANLRPGKEFDCLFAAARCRQQADWIVGLNATRCYTLRYGIHRELWSIGRVQTPVLALIVRRDEEISAFQSTPYWTLLTTYRTAVFQYTKGRFKQRTAGESMLAAVQGQPFSITGINHRQEQVKPPQLYDLTELQREMNRRYNLSAASTLSIAQALYEQKTITYPRTDSRYLSQDITAEVPGILHSLRPLKNNEIAKLDLTSLPFNARIVNDEKVTDHHAIIPTGKIPHALETIAARVYDAILTRLIAVFYPPCLKQIATIDGMSNQLPFQARGTTILDAGWTALYPEKGEEKESGSLTRDSETESENQALPHFIVGETGTHQPYLKESQTKPPRHYTENTLLADMETAGKYVTDEEIKESLKDKGIGTPATRAAIIELLVSRHYIQRIKKTLSATPAGAYLISLIPTPIIKSPELTGEWEGTLRRVEKGLFSPTAFMAEIKDFTLRVLAESQLPPLDENRIGNCPVCSKPIIQGHKGYGCSGWKDGCKVVVWMDYRGHRLTLTQARELFQWHRLAALIQVHDHGTSQTQYVYLDERGRMHGIKWPILSTSAQRPSGGARNTGKKNRRAAPDKASLGACPLCQSPVAETPKSFGCSAWKSTGCRFVIWKKMAGKTIAKTTAKTLLKNGQTSLLKGFKHQSGKEFAAALRIENGEVKFLIPHN